MTKLECSVKNCVYNEEPYCCKGDIMVEGRDAKNTSETACASFKAWISAKGCSRMPVIKAAITERKSIVEIILRLLLCMWKLLNEKYWLAKTNWMITEFRRGSKGIRHGN